MSADEQMPTNTTTAVVNADAMDEGTGGVGVAVGSTVPVEAERSEKILKAKELYNQGSRNFLVKSYIDAADELSQVCALYEELYGELSDELGMPYLLYAKSLIALALDENKVIDVPDEEEDDDDDDDDGGDDGDNAANANGKDNETGDKEAASKPKEEAEKKSTNGATVKLDTIKEVEKSEADSAVTIAADAAAAIDTVTDGPVSGSDEKSAETHVTSSSSSSSGDAKADNESKSEKKNSDTTATKNGTTTNAIGTVVDDEKPSTSNGEGGANGDAEEMEEENEAASNLQLAWEILELAAKIFSRQGLSGLSNLAEVQTELGNIEFENSVLDAAREDYEKALNIYKDLPTNYRRAMAEIHYKIGLTYLMQQLNKEGAESLKEACTLIEGEIEEIKAKEELTDKDKNNIQDMEETKQEIWAKISEIEETQAQNVAEVRAALDSYIKPITSQNADGASSSSSSSVATAAAASSSAATASSSSSASALDKPKDISHLIKRKKPDEPSSTELDGASPAKRPAV